MCSSISYNCSCCGYQSRLQSVHVILRQRERTMVIYAGWEMGYSCWFPSMWEFVCALCDCIMHTQIPGNWKSWILQVFICYIKRNIDITRENTKSTNEGLLQHKKGEKWKPRLLRCCVCVCTSNISHKFKKNESKATSNIF